MSPFIYLLVFGPILGSFLNMLIYRLPRGLNYVSQRSMCPHCKHTLGLKDLVPIFSYCFSWGKCRYCHTGISFRYVLVEILSTALLFLAYYQVPDFTWTSHFYILSIFYLAGLAVFFIDLETYIIPDELSLGLVCLGLINGFLTHSLMAALYGMLAGYFVFLLIALLSKFIYKQDAMGGGDLKLAAGIGALFGLKFVLITTYLSFVIGAAIGLLSMLFFKKKSKDRIPFGPMIIVAALLTQFFFERINLYINTLF